MTTSTLPRLWIPGPTEVRAEILAECARPMVGHRTPEMAALIERLDPHLPFLFGFDADGGSRAAVASASATAMMEGSLHGVGERVLSVVNGAFSKRFCDLARTLGKQVHAIELPFGEAVTEEALARALDEHGPFDALTVVANETSTGVRTPLEPVVRVVRERAPDTLVLVDVVTLAAGADVAMDRLDLDFAVTGSQKALALPPGLAPFAVSERYLHVARGRARSSWYLDPVRLVDGHAGRKTPTTPAIGLYRALARQLEDCSAGLLEGGAASPAAAWAARFDRHARMAERTRDWAAGHGLCPFPARAEWASPTVACVATVGLDVAAWVSALLARGLRISNGYGDLKGRTLRIGHMGDHSEADLETLLAEMDATLPAVRGSETTLESGCADAPKG